MMASIQLIYITN